MIHTFISSVNRVNPADTPAAFTVQLTNSIRSSSCELDFAAIPNTYYNITSINNSFNLDAAPFIVAAGNYSLKTLITAIQSLIGANYTVSYNPITNLVGILSATSPLTPFTLIPGTLFKILGFTQASYSNVVSVYGELAPKVFDTCIFINLSLGALSQSNLPLTGITFPVVNNANPGDIIPVLQKFTL